MARVRVNQQRGFLLHRRPYSESSLIIDIFTHEHGRLALIAKGCRKKNNQAQGLFLPFKPLLFSWTGKGELPILTGIEAIEHFRSLDPVGLNCGLYINELILKLLHRHDSHERLFEKYHELVYSLLNGGNPFTLLRVFEKHLLQETGFGLVLDHDTETGESIIENASYNYIPEMGPVKVGEGSPDTITGDTLIAFQNEHFTSSHQHKQARRLTRFLLDIQLNGRQLRSRRVIREMKRFSRQAQE